MKLSGVVMVALIYSGPAAAQADRCRDILVDGVQDRISTFDKNDQYTAAKRWFCSRSESSRTYSDSASASATVPIYGVPVQADASKNSAEASQARSRFCSSTTDKFSNNQLRSLYKQIASRTVVTAWSDCMKNALGSNLPVTLTAARVSPTTFTISAKFNPTLSGQSAPVIDYIQVVGATCAGSRFRRGKTIPIQGITEICEQPSRRNAAVIIGTTYGDLRTSIELDTTGLPAGRVSITYLQTASRWVGGPRKSVQRTTGDHHCSSGCSGEPTRTNYQLVIDAGSNERLVDPVNLQCIGGPCGGWNQVMAVHQNGQRALGSWDVWTRPSTWELSVGSETRESYKTRVRSAETAMSVGEIASIEVPRGGSSPRLEVRTNSGTRTYSLDNNEDDGVDVISANPTESGTLYRFKLTK